MKNNNQLKAISTYRPEIDGLRALAIISVIINHFNKEILPNGYLGVDIFFVISGFIITSSILNRQSRNFKNFILEFYERRIKRLLPALSVFVLTTGILICIFSQSPGQSLKTGIASLFGLSNIYLYRLDTNYFSSFTELNTFTHTWSLGVEEQFYFIFPFLIWFTGYAKNTKNCIRNLFISIVLLALPSFIGFIYFHQSNQAATYFLMPYRFWEMATGCILFLASQKKSSLIIFFEKIPCLLLTLIIIGIMFIPNLNAGFSTSLIVLLTTVLISTLKKEKKSFKYYSHPYSVFIGKLSYSLYLWHWGILAISRWTIGIHWWTIPFQVLLIFGTALISYRFIEQPFRKLSWFQFKWINFLFSGGVVLTISGILYLNGKPLKGYIFVGKDPIYTTPNYNSCHLPELGENTTSTFSQCGSFNYENSPTIYGLGDSHIEQFGYAISDISKKNNYNYSILWQSNCFFPASLHKNKISNCFKNQSQLEKNLIRNISDGDIVIVGNYLFDLINSEKSIYYDNFGKPLSKRKAVEIYERKFIKFSEEVTKKGGKVVLYIDSPIFPNLDLPGAICKEEWFRKSYNVPDKCKINLSSHINIFEKYFSWKDNWKDNKSKYVLDGYKYYESCKNDTCLASYNSDSNHITYQYAKRILNIFMEESTNLLDNN